MNIGYHCSHEQFSPRELLDFVQQAEAAGFNAAMSSEHIAPWSVRQGESGFAWAWLGAALQATEHLPFGALAIPGGWRYHPVVVAHAFATLSQMFPGRCDWIAAGSGEAANEIMVGEGWPEKPERHARLLDGVRMLRALWRGETVNSNRLIKAEKAKLWTLPEKPPQIYGAALSAETAAWLGSWADGLITVRTDTDTLQVILKAFRDNGGAGKPLVLQLQISWAETLEQARVNAHDQWRHTAVELERDKLKTPQEFDAACAHVQLHEMDDALFVCTDAAAIIAEIKTFASLGFGEIHIHNAGRNQREFIAFFKEHVLPVFAS